MIGNRQKEFLEKRGRIRNRTVAVLREAEEEHSFLKKRHRKRVLQKVSKVRSVAGLLKEAEEVLRQAEQEKREILPGRSQK